MTRQLRILQMTAIGDAAGAGYEYLKTSVAQFRLDWGYRQHPLHTEIVPGMFTDDTMLSVAMADGLLAGQPWDARRFADAMVDLHKRWPTTGYSKGMLAALDASANGAQLIKICAEHGKTQKNGAAMRAAVFGILPTPEQVRRVTEAQAGVTHERGGIDGALAVALASHYLSHRLGPYQKVASYLDAQLKPISCDWQTRFKARVASKNGPLGIITVQAALTALTTSTTLSQVLEKSIRVGGDVDTVAAIAMGLAASCDTLADDLPPWLWEQLLPVKGCTPAHLQELDAKLTTLWRELAT